MSVAAARHPRAGAVRPSVRTSRAPSPCSSFIGGPDFPRPLSASCGSPASSCSRHRRCADGCQFQQGDPAFQVEPADDRVASVGIPDV